MKNTKRSDKIRRRLRSSALFRLCFSGFAILYLTFLCGLFAVRGDGAGESVSGEKRPESAGADGTAKVGEELPTAALGIERDFSAEEPPEAFPEVSAEEPSEAFPEVSAEEAVSAQDAQSIPAEQTPLFSGFSSVGLQTGSGVLTLPMEEYVLGALLSEMPSSFHAEALKAQAVACRTYAVYKLSHPQKHKSGAALCESPACCQAYVPPESVSEERLAAAKSAVEATAGEILCCDGEPILAVFHASSGKKTSSSAEVWGGQRTYLVSVESGESENPELADACVAVYTFSKENFASSLRSLCPPLAFRGDGEILAEITLEKSESGRVRSLRICENDIDAAAFVRAFGLRSRDFSISVGENVTVTTDGYGHGVGLSQLGAEDMAQKGYDYRAVLEHYYTGVSFGRIEE